ncbi:MAG: hypothetical protein E6L08_13580 [Verrucomicrobia bacterium]|nr:MAG: hypothetical protein E6L08_13580 [Verrucomicrobiota bacterium]
MKFIELRDGTMLNVNFIKSYKVEESESVDEIYEGGGSIRKKTGEELTKETVLKINTDDGDSYTLQGSVADAALKVLEGC